MAQALFEGVQDRTLGAIQQSFDSGNPHTAGFPLPGVTATVKTAVIREKQDGFNVVGYLPATARIALPKPAPDIFLDCAANLGAAPAACVAFEDSVAGIDAIRAAGMRAIGIGAASALPSADQVYATTSVIDIERVLAP